MDSENLLKTKLFKNLNDNEFQILARNLGFYKHKFKKGENILRTGETINSFGLVISGSVNIEYNDIFGNTNIIGNADSGQVFAEAYSAAGGTADGERFSRRRLRDSFYKHEKYFFRHNRRL